MSFNATHEFPSPVGGIPYDIDFAPSTLFSVLYAFLIPVVLYRSIHRRSRNMVLLGTVSFAIERVVAYALRAHAAHTPSARESEGLETYFQTTLSAGFISIGQDVAVLLRSLLVSTTFGTLPSTAGTGASSLTGDVPNDVENLISASECDTPGRNQGFAPLSSAFSVNESEDQPRHRFWMRRLCGGAMILFWVTVILSVVAGIDYKQAIDSGSHAALVQRLRYASTGLAVFLLVGLACGALYAAYALPRVPKGPAMYIVLVSTLLSIVGFYRLIVMRHSTSSLFSTGPGSLNTNSAKAAFYIFHVAPEWLGAALLMSVNVRRLFKTGLWGDGHSSTPMPDVK